MIQSTPWNDTHLRVVGPGTATPHARITADGVPQDAVDCASVHTRSAVEIVPGSRTMTSAQRALFASSAGLSETVVEQPARARVAASAAQARMRRMRVTPPGYA